MSLRLFAIIATFFVAACSGIAPSPVGGNAAFAMTPSLVAGAPATVPTSTTRSWLSPLVGTTSKELFISDSGANALDIFALPSLQEIGQISDANVVAGLCNDQAGNVWAVNEGINEAAQYSHSGTLLRTIDTGDGAPASCAVNPANGDLAVTHISTGNLYNTVTVFHGHEKHQLSCSGMIEAFFAGYTAKGLYYDGVEQTSRSGMLCVGNKPVTVSGVTFNYPGMVEGYGPSQLVVGDQECGPDKSVQTCLYVFKLSSNGLTATYESTIDLIDYAGNALCDMPQGTMWRGQVLGPNSYGPTCSTSGSNSVNVWAFPAGGQPKRYNDTAPLREPIGAALSIVN